MGLQRVGLAAALALTLGSSGAALAAPMQIVVMGGLDKVTAHVSTFEVPVGKTVTFGALQITARACDKHPPEETPESAAFLEVVEARPGETPHQLFTGWMFASSPALSAMDNPIYDLWVLDCKNPVSASGATSP
ncbi:MAG TPA: DUF2155 domain-containing protein [Dongiaceae bacterium]|jgi:hypothetical protein|nr:DUF2155 domain-containing protein [Dongiaceae bacterium]